MAKIFNVSVKQFRDNVKNKKIVLWGAGKLASYYVQTFCEGLKILFIVDKNEEVCGKNLLVEHTEYPVISVDKFLNKLETEKELMVSISIFITPTAYAGEIIKYINGITLLNMVDCYVGVLMRDYCELETFNFSAGKDKIPKKIHYCWFGGGQIPEHLKKYMESWNKFCPDYDIIRWDENNYDISKNKYMKEAYECGKWAFVPDYARLDIIYNEGGIYLDTDVELLTSLDRLLKDDMFCGFSCNFQIGLGVGFGAIKGHLLIKELRDFYDDLSFRLPNGKLNLTTCYEYQHPVLKKYGFSLENSYQKKNDVVIYPSEVLSPDAGLIFKNYSNNTVSVHHFEYSWASEEEKEKLNLFKEEVKNLELL